MTQIFHLTLVHGHPHCLYVKFQKILSVANNDKVAKLAFNFLKYFTVKSDWSVTDLVLFHYYYYYYISINADQRIWSDEAKQTAGRL